MKFPRDIPEKIVLNAPIKNTSPITNQPRGKATTTFTKRSNQDIMKTVPFTLYTSSKKEFAV